LNKINITFRLKGFEPDCPDSCAYTKDGAPPDEIWCFKTSTSLVLYPATDICLDTTANIFTTQAITSQVMSTTQSTLQTGSTSSPKVISTTAGIEKVPTKKVRFKINIFIMRKKGSKVGNSVF
jgi:hypothetical protein